jgi:hypothetical protein
LVDAQGGNLARAEVLDRHKKAGVQLGAGDSERVNLAEVRIAIRMPPVSTGRRRTLRSVILMTAQGGPRGC